MSLKKHILDEIPFDKDVMEKARKYMRPYDGVHWIWWVFWGIACFPVLILVLLVHLDKVQYATKYNNYVYHSVYTNTEFTAPSKDPSPWVVRLLFCALLFFIYWLIK